MNQIRTAKNNFDDNEMDGVYRGMSHSWERRARKLQDRQMKSLMRKTLYNM